MWISPPFYIIFIFFDNQITSLLFICESSLFNEKWSSIKYLQGCMVSFVDSLVTPFYKFTSRYNPTITKLQSFLISFNILEKSNTFCLTCFIPSSPIHWFITGSSQPAKWGEMGNKVVNLQTKSLHRKLYQSRSSTGNHIKKISTG